MEIDKLTDTKRYKFITIYAKDRRFYNLIGDYLAEQLHTGTYARYEPTSVEEFADLIPLSYTVPLGYERWLFQLDYERVKLNRSLSNQIRESTTTTTLIYTEEYKSHQIADKLFGYPSNDCVNLMFVTMNRSEASFFQDYLVPNENKLSPALLNKVVKGYRTRPDKILDLLFALKDTKIYNYRDIVRMLGASDNTQESYIIKLLQLDIVSERSLKTQMRNRYKELEDLSIKIGYQPLRGYLLHTLKDIINVKMDYLHGLIYKDIRNREVDPSFKPPPTDEKAEEHLDLLARRLNRYLYDIKMIPVSRMVLLLQSLRYCGNFRNNMDTYDFILHYMMSVLDYRGDIEE